MIFFAVCIYTETVRFFMTKLISAAAANISSFCHTDFASG